MKEPMYIRWKKHAEIKRPSYPVEVYGIIRANGHH